jgi:hypothetical protein
MLGPERPKAELPDKALSLPTFSHLLIFNKTSLTLSHSLSRARARVHSLSFSLQLT